MPENIEGTGEQEDVVSNTVIPDNPPQKDKPRKTDTTKRDLAFIQKKIAELEIAVSDVQDNVQKADTSGLQELKQRVEDIEDLTMVENAAVIELKKMLEGVATKDQGQPSPLEERLVSIEQKMSEISMPNVDEMKNSIMSSLPAADTTKLDAAVSEIKTDLENKLTSIEQKVSLMEGKQSPNLDMLKEDVKNYVVSSMPNNDWVKNELQSFRMYLDAEKMKMDSSMERIEKDLQTPLPEKAVEELKKIEDDWRMNSARVDAIEKFVENFSNEINQLKPIIKKLETFEKLIDLQNEIAEKLETFKEYRDHIEKTMEMNEELERNIQKEVVKVKNTEKMFSRIDESLSSMTTELEKNKMETDEIVRPLEERLEMLDKEMKDLQDMIMNFDKKFDTVGKTIATMQDDMSVFQGTMMGLEQSDNTIKSTIADLQTTLNPEEGETDIASKLDNIENKIENIKSTAVFSDQIEEIVSRLVFMESRLAAMEGVMQNTRYPIIVE